MKHNVILFALMNRPSEKYQLHFEWLAWMGHWWRGFMGNVCQREIGSNSATVDVTANWNFHNFIIISVMVMNGRYSMWSMDKTASLWNHILHSNDHRHLESIKSIGRIHRTDKFRNRITMTDRTEHDYHVRWHDMNLAIGHFAKAPTDKIHILIGNCCAPTGELINWLSGVAGYWPVPPCPPVSVNGHWQRSHRLLPPPSFNRICNLAIILLSFAPMADNSTDIVRHTHILRSIPLIYHRCVAHIQFL